MIRALALFIVFASATAFGSDHEFPQNLCWKGSCSEPQLKIEEGFNLAGPITEDQIDRVYSGECFHRSYSTDSNHAHHGVIYLSPHNSEIQFHGLFGFFHKENPYATMTLDEAKVRMPLKDDPKYNLHFEDKYAWVDMNPGQIPIWQYYLRHSNNTIWLVAFWDIKQTVFCELKQNP